MDKNLKKNKKHTDIVLSEGILLTGGLHRQYKGALSNLLVRAVFLFAIVVGSLGGMLSAFQISYAKWAFFLSAFLAAFYCASLYLSVWWENIGYILILFLAMYTGLSLRTYISSGFYGILNDISASASLFFGSEAQVNYAEQVENHSFAISVAMCYFALIGCTIANGLISRKSKYLAVSVPSVLFLLVPVYLEHEPAALYIILLTIGFITVYIHRRNRYTCHQPNSKTLYKAAGKHILLGNFSGSAAMTALLAVTILCTIVVTLAGLFIPKDTYLQSQKQSSVKLKTMDTMENFYLLGVMGLINFYPSTGGLESGRLGGVSSVRLDYEPDLNLTFVPYTYDRIYLKSFTGAEYLPYENRWSIDDQTAYVESWKHDTADRLEEAFLSGADGYAMGRMDITNLAAMIGVYLPYYSKASGTMIRPGSSAEYTFFPLLTEIPVGRAEPLVSGLWLDVPEENLEAVASFCAKADLSGSPEEIVIKLRGYFQKEFPYTLSPGATPRRKDFVNYFLEEKRKGYCAHYASSAVLILRYMGIPARYAEGYAVDAVEVAADAEQTEANVADYYEGTSLLPQNSVISYDVTDGSAHAWVEIYDENLGWYPVEVTPYRTSEEEERSGIWDLFARLFQTEENVASADVDAPDANGNPGNAIMNAIQSSAPGIAFALIMLLPIVPVWIAVRRVIAFYRYKHAGRNEKLLILYRKAVRTAVHKASRRQRRQKVHVGSGKRHTQVGLTNTVKRATGTQTPDNPTSMKNFEEQVEWLAENNIITQDPEKLARLIRILNEAAFAPNEITEEAFAEGAAYFD